MKTKDKQDCKNKIREGYLEMWKEEENPIYLISIAARWCALTKHLNPQTQKSRIKHYYQRAHYYLKQARKFSPFYNRRSINWLIARSLHEDFGDSKGAIEYAKKSLEGLSFKEAKGNEEFISIAYEELRDYPKSQEYSLRANIKGYAEERITDKEVINTNIDKLFNQLIDLSNLD
tara:strand:+ start:1743 stop:2267 length:525 start_codon:yes stop_codon:yes gene_type:complete